MGERRAVVIGSGPNGLAAAITLARAGRDVLVLEGADRWGGAVGTAETTLPGFRQDPWSAVHPAAAASPVFARFELARHGLEWVHPRYPMAHVLEGGRAAVLSRDVEETAASLDGLHAGDGARWAAFARELLPRVVTLPRIRRAALRPRGMLELARVALMPASALASELFQSEESRSWLYGSALHGDVPVNAGGSAAVGVGLQTLGHAVGWPSPRGGAQRLADALVACLRAHGGDVRTGAPVARVTSDRRRATGVELAGGERIPARLVIADVAPRGLLALAGAALPEPYRAGLTRFRHGAATFKVDWALDAPIPWAAEEVRGAGTVHVGGRLGDGPLLICGQQSVADPTRAPAGKHTAWAYVHGPQGAEWDRDATVDAIEARLEEFAPGFRGRILARHVQAPEDFERSNPNLVGGDIGNGSFAIDQLLFRPIPSLVPYRTPLRGLYLGSAATPPGGAVHGVCGYAAARLALIEQRIRPGGR